MQFQFLIGRLRTDYGAGRVSVSPAFQFLIGRLRTYYGAPCRIREKEFQFLIGRLRTILPLRAGAEAISFNSS